MLYIHCHSETRRCHGDFSTDYVGILASIIEDAIHMRINFVQNFFLEMYLMVVIQGNIKNNSPKKLTNIGIAT